MPLAGLALIDPRRPLHHGAGARRTACAGVWSCARWPSFARRPGVIDLVQGPFWFLLKVFVVLFVYVWVRWTLPRFRYDQLMDIGWKLLLPLTLVNVVLTSLAVVVRK